MRGEGKQEVMTPHAVADPQLEEAAFIHRVKAPVPQTCWDGRPSPYSGASGVSSFP